MANTYYSQVASEKLFVLYYSLFGDRQTLPKTPEKTEMILRFPLGFS